MTIDFSMIQPFIDIPSAIIVILFGIIMMMGNMSRPQGISKGWHRLDKFVHGSVLGGWIGFMIGIVMLSGSITTVFGPGMGYAVLPLLYGYLISFIRKVIG